MFLNLYAILRSEIPKFIGSSTHEILCTEKPPYLCAEEFRTVGLWENFLVFEICMRSNGSRFLSSEVRRILGAEDQRSRFGYYVCAVCAVSVMIASFVDDYLSVLFKVLDRDHQLNLTIFYVNSISYTIILNMPPDTGVTCVYIII